MASNYDKERKAAKKEYDKKVKSGQVGYVVESPGDPTNISWREKGVWLHPTYTQAYAEYVYKINQINLAEREEETKAIEAAKGTSNSELNDTVESGTNVESTATIVEQSSTTKKALLKKALDGLKKGIDTLNSAVSWVANKANQIKALKNKYIDSNIAKANQFYNKIMGGLSDPKFLSKIAKQYGLTDGFVGGLLSDALDLGNAYANSYIKSALSFGLESLIEKLNVPEYYDDTMKRILIVLHKCGGNPNYQSVVLNEIVFVGDTPKVLEWLDDLNDTVYSMDTTEYKRAEYAARKGCHKVALYICKKLYDIGKTLYASGKAISREDEALEYFNYIRKVFKISLVYSYSTFDKNAMMEWFDTFNDILKPSMFSINDTTFSGRYAIKNIDLNVMAKPVQMQDRNGEFFDTFDLSTAKTKDYFKKETYIDIRNKHIKKLYVILANDENRFSTKTDLMVNKPFHDRLKYKALNATAKARSEYLNALNRSSIMRGAGKALDSVQSSIYNTIFFLKQSNLLYNVSWNKSTYMTKDTEDVGDFIDWSTVTITFHYSNDITEKQIVKSGVFTSLNKTEYTSKPDDNNYMFIGWGSSENSTTITYADKAKINITSDIDLYAVWKEKPEYYEEEDQDISNKTETTNTSKTEEEKENESNEILKKEVTLPSIFGDSYNFEDLVIIDTTKMSNNDLVSFFKELYNKNSDYKLLTTREMYRWNISEEKYSTLNVFKLYGTFDGFNDLTDSDKNLIFYYALAWHLIKTLYGDYDISGLKSLYGISSSDNIHVVDKDLSKALDAFSGIIDSIRNIYFSDSKICTVSFDNHGFGNTPSSFTVKSYSKIKDKKPLDLIDNVKQLVFKGWFKDARCTEMWDWDRSIVSDDIVLHAKWNDDNGLYPIKTLKISYRDKYDEKFSGNHELGYLTSFKNNENVVLDYPTLNGFEFIGYHLLEDCSDEPIYKLNAYTFDEDIILYANWISESEYKLYNDTLEISGIPIKIKDLIFYKKYVLKNNHSLVINETGFCEYLPNGYKYHDFTKSVGGAGYIVKGVTTIKSNNDYIERLILTVAKNKRNNRLYIFYSLNNGENWVKLIECTSFPIIILDICGNESTINLTYYSSVIYDNHIYRVSNDKQNIMVDNFTTPAIKTSDIPINSIQGQDILGIAITIIGDLYILYSGAGVIRLVDWIPSFEERDGVIIMIPALIDSSKVFPESGWKEGVYNISNSMGSPEIISTPISYIDDDFDIDDYEMIKRILSYYADSVFYIPTFKKIGNPENPISDEDWEWDYETNSVGIILPESYKVKNVKTYDSEGNLVNITLKPSIYKNKELVPLMKKSTTIFKTTDESKDVYLKREVDINRNNYKQYIGWTREINDGESVLITEEYCINEGILESDNSNTWTIYYSRSEVEIKTVSDIYGNPHEAEVYKGFDYTESKSFENYLSQYRGK